MQAKFTKSTNFHTAKDIWKRMTDINGYYAITSSEVFNASKGSSTLLLFQRSFNVGPMDLRIFTETGKIIDRVLEIKATNSGLVMYCIQID